MDEIELLYQALNSPLGIVVAVSNFEKVKMRLYSKRRETGDPDLDILQFRRSPYSPESEMWIVKGAKKNEQD